MFFKYLKKNFQKKIKEKIKIRTIPYNSNEYKEVLDMRQLLIRIPYNLNLYNENLSIEKDYINLIAESIEKKK